MASLQSWLEIDPKSQFSLHNLPFGIISTAEDPQLHPAIAIGDYALDLHVFTRHNGFAALSIFQPYQAVFLSQSTLNHFAALGRPMHKVVRGYLQSVLLKDGPFPGVFQENESLRSAALIPLQRCQMHLPMRINDYTDFYAGLHHAYNVGVLFRGPDNALQPNYTHLPVGYHGRASSIVVSGTPIRRPNGQIFTDPTTKTPALAPCRKLDMELELGCFVCKPSALGQPIAISDAQEHLFGFVLLNDWSARDIQAWEYVPLGPFNSKNFGTTISPWVVLMDALEPFATTGIDNKVKPLPYLDEKGKETHFDINLTTTLTTASGKSTTICRTNAKNLLFSFPQMLAHHTVGGCPFNVGDLLGSGTISGKEKSAKGCLLEQSENGKVSIRLEDGEERTFLQDGDTVMINGVSGSEGSFVGFGNCSGRIEAALDLEYD
ncbi:hypothetical protein LTR62_008352 [Meristemomyces frigidus]|uniref:Fumarylacetoacetase n=1 Tax=Meristemomyces frigidus TaxID=1508187 RepID=A0AAN7YCU9_9PEZI|nr:hypothetical protein LTR62_008352 [Meristemomyces frigidus]